MYHIAWFFSWITLSVYKCYSYRGLVRLSLGPTPEGNFFSEYMYTSSTCYKLNQGGKNILVPGTTKEHCISASNQVN